MGNQHEHREVWSVRQTESAEVGRGRDAAEIVLEQILENQFVWTPAFMLNHQMSNDNISYWYPESSECGPRTSTNSTRNLLELQFLASSNLLRGSVGSLCWQPSRWL